MKVEFSTRQTVVGTKCDYNANPYKVYTSDDGVDWLEVASNLRGDHTFTEPLSTKFARYRWESTLGSNGFHFQFLASPPNLQPPLGGATTTLAGSGSAGFGNGAGGSARFNNPHDIAIDPSGTFALVAVRRPPPYPRIPPSRRRHNTRLAHGVGA